MYTDPARCDGVTTQKDKKTLLNYLIPFTSVNFSRQTNRKLVQDVQGRIQGGGEGGGGGWGRD